MAEISLGSGFPRNRFKVTKHRFTFSPSDSDPNEVILLQSHSHLESEQKVY